MPISLLAAELPKPESLPVVPGFPDPLVLRDGKRVSSREQWRQERVPELRELFQHYEYGFLPKPAKVEAVLEREDANALDGKAHLKEVALSWGMPGVTIHLLLVVPKGKPAPVFLGLNFNGNHQVLPDPKVRMPDGWMRTTDKTHRANEAARGREEYVWNVRLAVERGYGIATFYNGDVVPDEPVLAAERLKLFRPAERGAAPAPDDCATIAAWAWGLSRAADYLVTDAGVDPKRLAVVGHSRNGKTALLAGAMDERFALVVPLQAGCGGTAPSRVAPELSAPQANGRPTVETVSRINTSFPHWFCENFKAFGAEPARLPFDQHELMALCAPRPLLIAAATDDAWANPPGQYALAQAADPVYRLTCGDGLDASRKPEADQLIPSRLGYFLRTGKHEMNVRDWAAFLDFADRWLK